jgi:hypothetical protein
VLAIWLVAPVQAGAFESLIALPGPGVTVPGKLPPLPPVSVPVKAPSPPALPPPPVKIPPPVKLPPPPVRLPQPPVRVPTPGKAPTVPSKAPVRIPTPTVKAPVVAGKPTAPGASHTTTPVVRVPVTSPVASQPRPSAGASPAPSGASGPLGGATSSSAGASAFAPSAVGTSGSLPFSGYGGGAGATTAPVSAGSSRAHAAALRHERAVRRVVQRLAGCLASLPERLRLVLELRTGVAVRRALGPKAVAAFVHVPVKQVAPLELSGLRQLRANAGTNACAAPASSAPVMVLASYFETPSEGSAASGGVAGARYSKSPTRTGLPASPSSQGGGSLLGLSLPHAGSLLLWILTALVGATLLAFLFADGLGTGPRHRHWRARWLSQPRRALRHMRSRL